MPPGGAGSPATALHLSQLLDLAVLRHIPATRALRSHTLLVFLETPALTTPFTVPLTLQPTGHPVTAQSNLSARSQDFGRREEQTHPDAWSQAPPSGPRPSAQRPRCRHAPVRLRSVRSAQAAPEVGLHQLSLQSVKSSVQVGGRLKPIFTPYPLPPPLSPPSPPQALCTSCHLSFHIDCWGCLTVLPSELVV